MRSLWSASRQDANELACCAERACPTNASPPNFWSPLRASSQARRQQFQAEGRAKARTGDALHLQGCILYWAEGGKGRNSAIFSNSDVHMQRLFRRFLHQTLDVAPDQMRLKVNVHLGNGLSVPEIERHSLDALDLPPTSLRKGSVNRLPRSSSGQAKGSSATASPP